MDMKRALNQKEIQSILDEIDNVPKSLSLPVPTQQSIRNNLKKDIAKQLKSVMIYPAGIPRLREEIISQYHKTMVQPGESVGILTAQSIGERQTQMTLNTFHSAGMAIATVITGVPRFGELLNATKDPKMVSCQIYFNECDEDLESLRKYIGPSLRQFTLRELMVSHTINLEKTPEKWYDGFMIFRDTADVTIDMLCGDITNDIKAEYGCISIQLDPKIVFEYSINLGDIANKIESDYEDIVVISSPVNLAQIDIFINLRQIQNNPSDIFLGKNDSVIYMENIVRPVLFDMVVCGIPNIKNFFYKKYNVNEIADKTKSLKQLNSAESKKSRWMVETQGSNFMELLAHSKIKKDIVVSNNMWDIYEALGIEAAREFLIDEFMNVVSSDGSSINIRHVMLLVDLMTFSGTISSISRYGVKRDQAGPLAKASFEESLDNFLKAGVFGDVESTKGISASIMCGKRSQIGTGLCDIMYDFTKLKNPPNQPNQPTQPTQMINSVTENIFTDLSHLKKTFKVTDIDSIDNSGSEIDCQTDNDSSIFNDDDIEQTDSEELSSSERDETSSESVSDGESDESGEPGDLIFNDDQMDNFMKDIL